VSIVTLKKVSITTIAIIAVLAIAGLARYWGLDFGLPFLYNTDEPNFVTRAFRILGTGDLNPHWFGHPGSFTIYSLSLVFGLYASIGLMLGHFPDLSAIEVITRTEPSEFYFVGRLLILFFGMLAVYLTYLMGKRGQNRTVGLISASIMAIAPLSVELSRLIRTDMQMTALILITVIYCFKIIEKPKISNYIIAGLFLGLSVATKYPAIFGCLPIIAAHFISQSNQGIPLTKNFAHLLTAATFSLIGAFLAAPYLFIDIQTALNDILGEARSTHLSSTSYGFTNSIFRYFYDVILSNVSLAGGFFALISVFVIVKKPRDNYFGIVVLSFFIPFLFFISSLNLWWERWAMPLIPFACYLAAHGVYISYKIFEHTRLKFFVATSLVIALILPLRETLLDANELAQGDTRTHAYRWSRQNISENSLILVESYSPQLPTESYRLIQPGFMDEDFQPASTKYYRALGVIGELEDTKDIVESDPDYIILSDQYDRRLAGGEPYAHSMPIYNYIFRNYDKVFEVKSIRGSLAGNVVRIYSKPKSE
jgi:4-amino-4-deoxy-L-arabinose transferase-like glycosyltransferase